MEIGKWDDDKSYPGRGWRRFILWLLIVIFGFSSLVIGGYRLINGFQYWRQNDQVRDSYVQAIEELKLEQQSLKEELYKLQYNRLTKERLARELGYIKPGETVYKIVSGKLTANERE